MSLRRTAGLCVAWAALQGCASFDVNNGDGGATDAGVGGDAKNADVGPHDATTQVDTGAHVDAPTPFDAGRDSGAAVDAGVDSGLSPLLIPPPPGGTECLPQDGDESCPPETTCRIASSKTGRCDGYTAGHEGTWPCAVDSDCGDTLQCYNGECKVLCQLGITCAGGCECLYVGSETTGICCPGS